MSIGIDTDRGLFYEGYSNGNNRPIWPEPILIPAKFVSPTEENPKLEVPKNHGYQFREDYFDLVSRIRRGRFYYINGSEPQTWKVPNHPGDPWETPMPTDGLGWLKKLVTFNRASIWESFVKDEQSPPIVLLGVGERFTIWTIINIEITATCEEIVTLKGRNSFGILPHLKNDAIPKEFQAGLNEKLDKFANEVHRSSPDSVIDRARDAATQACLTHFNLKGKGAKDLGDLATELKSNNLLIAANAASILAILHSRTKAAEQARRENLPQIREQDTDLATQCLGTLLCELGYAAW